MGFLKIKKCKAEFVIFKIFFFFFEVLSHFYLLYFFYLYLKKLLSLLYGKDVTDV